MENKDLAVDAILTFYDKCLDNNDKYKKLVELYETMNVGQSIIFLNTKKTA